MKTLVLLTVVLTAGFSVFANESRKASASNVAPFSNAERVAFLGDSITHGGLYHVNLQLFWDLRFPGSSTRMVNCGVSGDTAGGGAARYMHDVLPHQPDRVFVMFGMNDVGRDGFAEGKSTEAKRKARLNSYRKNMEKIADLVQSGGKNLVIMTPSPYDEYGKFYKPDPLVGCNSQGLAAFAQVCRELAAERKANLLELYAPLTEFISTQNDFMFCRQSDRVHPTPAGHIIMSALILEAMGVSPVVAKIEMNADGRIRKNVRAKVSDVKVSPHNISFSYAPASLPFPTPEEYLEADAVYPVSKKMNLEIIEIAGLPSGEYDLLTNGKTIGTFSAGQLAAGVNLALMPTPGATLAMEAWKISRKISSLQSRLRSFAMVENVAARHGAKADDTDDICTKMEEFVNRLEKNGSKYATYYSRQLAAYRRDKVQAGQLRAQEDDCRRRLAMSASKKVAYTIAIRPSAKQNGN